MLHKINIIIILIMVAQTMACVSPSISCHINAYVGKDIDFFIKNEAMHPKQILREDDGLLYVFEVKYTQKMVLPPSEPVIAQNLNNPIPPMQFYPNKNDNYWAWETPPIIPGTAKPTNLHSVTELEIYLLRVKTNPQRIIEKYSCTRH